MRIECVIDSASIISLCKCGLENHLRLTGWKFVSVKGVFVEVVEDGLAKGELDSLVAKRLFDSGTISLVGQSGKGLSVDDGLVQMAKTRNAVLFTNDVKLSRKGNAEGLAVLGSAGLCLLLLKARKIPVAGFVKGIGLLVERKRLSQGNAEKYLQEVA